MTTDTNRDLTGNFAVRFLPDASAQPVEMELASGIKKTKSKGTKASKSSQNSKSTKRSRTGEVVVLGKGESVRLLIESGRLANTSLTVTVPAAHLGCWSRTAPKDLPVWLDFQSAGSKRRVSTHVALEHSDKNLTLGADDAPLSLCQIVLVDPGSQRLALRFLDSVKVIRD